MKYVIISSLIFNNSDTAIQNVDVDSISGVRNQQSALSLFQEKRVYERSNTQ